MNPTVEQLQERIHQLEQAIAPFIRHVSDTQCADDQPMTIQYGDTTFRTKFERLRKLAAVYDAHLPLHPFKISFTKDRPQDATMAQALGVNERGEKLMEAMLEYADERATDVDLSDDPYQEAKERLYEWITEQCQAPNELFLLGYLMGSADTQEQFEER